MLDIKTKEEMEEEKNRLRISKILKGKTCPREEAIIKKLKEEKKNEKIQNKRR